MPRQVGYCIIRSPLHYYSITDWFIIHPYGRPKQKHACHVPSSPCVDPAQLRRGRERKKEKERERGKGERERERERGRGGGAMPHRSARIREGEPAPTPAARSTMYALLFLSPLEEWKVWKVIPLSPLSLLSLRRRCLHVSMYVRVFLPTRKRRCRSLKQPNKYYTEG